MRCCSPCCIVPMTFLFPFLPVSQCFSRPFQSPAKTPGCQGLSPSTCRFQGEREGGCGDVGNEVRKPSRKTSVLLVCYGATEQLQTMPPSATSHPFLSCLLISV